jgi:hypothetical protein
MYYPTLHTLRCGSLPAAFVMPIIGSAGEVRHG